MVVYINTGVLKVPNYTISLFQESVTDTNNWGGAGEAVVVEETHRLGSTTSSVT